MSSWSYVLYIAARSLLLYVNSHYQKKNAVFLLRGKQWEVKQRRGGMEGDEMPLPRSNPS